MRDGNYPRGEAHPATTLTDDDVRRIRKLYSETDLVHWELAALFGTSRATIGNIINRFTWGHVQ